MVRVEYKKIIFPYGKNTFHAAQESFQGNIGHNDPVQVSHFLVKCHDLRLFFAAIGRNGAVRNIVGSILGELSVNIIPGSVIIMVKAADSFVGGEKIIILVQGQIDALDKRMRFCGAVQDGFHTV